MSAPIFQARFQIINITATSPFDWDVTGTIHDNGFNFNSSSVQIGDVFFDESTDDHIVNRWKVIQIVSAGVPNAENITVKCIYDEEGSPAGTFGHPVPCDGAICRAQGDWRLAIMPSTGWTQVSETIKTSIINLNAKSISDSPISTSRINASGSNDLEVIMSNGIVTDWHSVMDGVKVDQDTMEIYNGELRTTGGSFGAQLQLTDNGSHTHVVLLTADNSRDLVGGLVNEVIIDSSDNLSHTHACTVIFNDITYEYEIVDITSNHGHSYQLIGLIGSQGEQGNQGIQGIQGIEGPAGDPAEVMIFKGAINLDSDFPASPSNGDVYTLTVDATDPYRTNQSFLEKDDIVWSVDMNIWVLLGNNTVGIQGPTGEQGTIGATGPTGADGINGGGDNIYRYQTNSGAGEEIWVVATALNVTTNRVDNEITFNVPIDVKLLSAKLRIAQTYPIAGQMIINTGDMGNVLLNQNEASRYQPIVYVNNEVTGNTQPITISLVSGEFGKTKINGLSNVYTSSIRLQW